MKMACCVFIVMFILSGCSTFTSIIHDDTFQDWAAVKIIRAYFNEHQPTPEKAESIIKDIDVVITAVTLTTDIDQLDKEVLVLISQLPPEDQDLLADIWTSIKENDIDDLDKFPDIKARVVKILTYSQSIVAEYRGDS